CLLAKRSQLSGIVLVSVCVYLCMMFVAFKDACCKFWSRVPTVIWFGASSSQRSPKFTKGPLKLKLLHENQAVVRRWQWSHARRGWTPLDHVLAFVAHASIISCVNSMMRKLISSSGVLILPRSLPTRLAR